MSPTRDLSDRSARFAALGPGGTGPLPLPFLVPVPVAFFLIEIEPGRRPAPASAPQSGPWCRTWPVVDRRAVREPKKRRRSSRLVQWTISICPMTAFENGVACYLYIKNWMNGWRYIKKGVINQMAPGNVWPTTPLACRDQRTTP